MSPLDGIFHLTVSLREPVVLDIGTTSTAEDLEAFRGRLASVGFYCTVISPDHKRDYEAEIIDQIDRGFSFPDYFGQNWNAVDECLADLTWLEASGYCTILNRSRELQELDRRIFDLLVDVFSTAGRIWLSRGVPFHLVLA